MPWADYICPDCDLVLHDIVFASRSGAAASAPYCPECGDGAEARMEPVPAANFDLKTDGDAGQFRKFTIHRQVPTRDGPVQQEEVIDSLHRVRQIERDSEQRYKDGEGEPLRFRGYTQDRSNLLINSFGDSGTIGDRMYDSGKAPSAPKPVIRHGQTKPRIAVAKGGGVSPLR